MTTSLSTNYHLLPVPGEQKPGKPAIYHTEMPDSMLNIRKSNSSVMLLTISNQELTEIFRIRLKSHSN
jgi:hypothetical protein